MMNREVPDSGHPPWRLSSHELLLIAGFWTFIATLSSVNRILDPRGFGLRMISPAAPIAMEFINSWIWAVVTPFVFILISRLTATRLSWLVRIAILMAIGLAVAIAVDLTLDLVRLQIVPPMRRRLPPFSPVEAVARFRFVNQLLVYLAVLAAGLARNFYLGDQARQRDTVQLQAHAAELQVQLSEARLDALRMQLNPHFLFNTLHAVSALVERDPAGVRRMIARLSELLRHTIDSHGADEVSLRDELEFLKRYIEIMEIRFQGQLQVSVNIQASASEALVPNFVLQPIVENAFEHGVNRSGSSMVTIEAWRDGERLLLSVRDNGPGLSENLPGRGVGVRNTEARLAQLYGNEAALTVEGGAGGGVTATIVIPYHTAADLVAGTFEEDDTDG